MRENLKNGNAKEILSEVNKGYDFTIEDNESSLTITSTKNQKK